ncbi:MAG: DUF6320 domain-containing protein [Suipraeoptans sp.]
MKSKYVNRSSKIESTLPLIRNIFTALCVIGILTCIICNLAIQGGLTWSLYPIAATLYAWLIAIPLFQFPRKGLAVTLCLATLLTVPFLYVLGVLSGYQEAMIYIGTRATAIGMAYLWIAYLIFSKMKNKLAAGGISIILAAPVAGAINHVVDTFTGIPRMDVWNYLSMAILVLAGSLFIVVGSWKK